MNSEWAEDIEFKISFFNYEAFILLNNLLPLTISQNNNKYATCASSKCITVA